MVRHAWTVVWMKKRVRPHLGDPGDPEAIAPQQIVEITERCLHQLLVWLQLVRHAAVRATGSQQPRLSPKRNPR